MFKFTPLLGAQTSSQASQSLLEFEGGIKVLVDIGWDSDFDVRKLRELEKHIPTLSIVLLTHATPAHIAAFAHCCKHFPLFTQIPIYATTPVISLGRTLLQDLYASAPQASTSIPGNSVGELTLAPSTSSDTRTQILLQPPTAEEIASYFALINPLRYSQPHQPLPSPFSPPLNGLTITAYNAGHSLGGTIWHIQHGMESVVYAVDWNLARENVISGAAWLGGGGGGSEVIEQLRKPTALICSSKGVERTTQALSRPKRDELLLDMIRNVLARGGTVLIPSDSSARVLELAWLLENTWRKSRDDADDVINGSKLYLASRSIGSTMKFAKSMIEWMDDNVLKVAEAEAEAEARKGHKKGDSRRKNETNKPDGEDSDPKTGPFNFRFLRLIERQSRFERKLSSNTPKVIIASDTSLDWGFSREAMQQLAGESKNLVLLTEELSAQEDSPQDSLGHTLWKWYQSREYGVAVETSKAGQNLDQVYTGSQELEIRQHSRAPLEDKEMALYQQYIATQKQLQGIQASGAANLESVNDAIEEASDSSSSEEESDDEQQGKSLNFSAKMLAGNRSKAVEDKDLQGVNALLRKPGFYDWDVRGKKGREAVFPYVNKRKRADEYGELIRSEDYLRAEERDEIDGQDIKDSPDGKKSGLGEKRKWGDTKMVSGDRNRRLSATGRKKQKVQRFGGSNQVNGEAAESSSDESEYEAEDILTGPSKLITTSKTIQVNLRLAFIDFAGLHDQRSLSMLIPLIQPRKVVLIGGTASETKSLAEECRQKLRSSGRFENVADDIMTPVLGQTVTASMDTHAWTVKLSRELVKRIQWQDVRGLGVVTLMGKLGVSPSSDDAKSPIAEQKRKRQRVISVESEESGVDGVGDKESGEKKAEEDLPPVLDVLPANRAAATRTVAQPLHVGDLRLADLRRILQANGQTAEFRGEGTLVIDNLVAVRKTASGQIEVESSGISLLPTYMGRGQESSFHAVKRRIYEGLAVIAGG